MRCLLFPSSRTSTMLRGVGLVACLAYASPLFAGADQDKARTEHLSRIQSVRETLKTAEAQAASTSRLAARVRARERRVNAALARIHLDEQLYLAFTGKDDKTAASIGLALSDAQKSYETNKDMLATYRAQLADADLALNGSLSTALAKGESSLRTTDASMMLASQAVFLKYTVHVRRKLPTAHTRSRTLEQSAGCKGDLVVDGMLWKYGRAALSEDFPAAAAAAKDIASQIACLSSSQLVRVEDVLVREYVTELARDVPLAVTDAWRHQALRNLLDEAMAPIFLLIQDNTKHLYFKGEGPAQRWLLARQKTLQQKALNPRTLIAQLGFIAIDRLRGIALPITSKCLPAPALTKTFRGKTGGSFVKFRNGSGETCSPLGAIVGSITQPCRITEMVPSGSSSTAASSMACASTCPETASTTTTTTVKLCVPSKTGSGSPTGTGAGAGSIGGLAGGSSVNNTACVMNELNGKSDAVNAQAQCLVSAAGAAGRGLPTSAMSDSVNGAPGCGGPGVADNPEGEDLDSLINMLEDMGQQRYCNAAGDFCVMRYDSTGEYFVTDETGADLIDEIASLDEAIDALEDDLAEAEKDAAQDEQDTGVDGETAQTPPAGTGDLGSALANVTNMFKDLLKQALFEAAKLIDEQVPSGDPPSTDAASEPTTPEPGDGQCSATETPGCSVPSCDPESTDCSGTCTAAGLVRDAFSDCMLGSFNAATGPGANTRLPGAADPHVINPAPDSTSSTPGGIAACSGGAAQLETCMGDAIRLCPQDNPNCGCRPPLSVAATVTSTGVRCDAIQCADQTAAVMEGDMCGCRGMSGVGPTPIPVGPPTAW